MEKKIQKHGQNKMDIRDFECLATLGQGNLGTVRLVKKKGSSKYMCVKIMEKEKIIMLKQVDHIFNQYRVSNIINHPFVVKFQGFAQNSKHLYIFMQYVPGGELFMHLREEGRFQPPKTAFYAAQVVSILDYLHKKNIIYRDLKPENILIGLDGYIKLVDFGFAKITEGKTYTLCGTPEYIAPQVLLNTGHGKAVDWWGLGVLIYEMIAGIDPFADEDPMMIYSNILKERLYFPKGFDEDAKSLIKHLLKKDLSKRYGNLKNGVADIKNHRFLNSINFENLIAKRIPSPFKPIVKSLHDTSNFQTYPDIISEGASIQPADDPFLNWDI